MNLKSNLSQVKQTKLGPVESEMDKVLKSSELICIY